VEAERRTLSDGGKTLDPDQRKIDGAQRMMLHHLGPLRGDVGEAVALVVGPRGAMKSFMRKPCATTCVLRNGSAISGNPVQEIMENIEPEPYERLRQSPRFIQLMADAAPTTVTRIVNEVPEGEPPFLDLDNDFSPRTIERHKKAGYGCAKRALCGGTPFPATDKVLISRSLDFKQSNRH
jgi:hypothetical protein